MTQSQEVYVAEITSHFRTCLLDGPFVSTVFKRVSFLFTIEVFQKHRVQNQKSCEGFMRALFWPGFRVQLILFRNDGGNK